MENYKTAEYFIKDHDYGNGKLDKKGALEAMKEYAEQEVKKHLILASNNAKSIITFSFTGIETPIVLKESITDINIQLT